MASSEGKIAGRRKIDGGDDGARTSASSLL